jgi:hypothetical protein
MTKRTWAVFAIISALAWAAPTRVGAEKCKMCHKIQFDSWTASKHAKLSPVQDCESCHGPGSEYKTIAVMKNLEAAKKAGLLVPTKADCAKCHGKGKVPAMTDALFVKVHAHKAKS